MSQEHPITPPPELVQQWFTEGHHQDYCSSTTYAIHQAARWGADQELEACLDQLRRWGIEGVENLRNTRRPKPPSLKEQAKFAAAVLRSPDETCSIAELQQHWHTICNALEQLND